MTSIFVFGSNLGGRHGKGAALHALHNFGAIYGQGAGLQGQSYAIPTKDARLKVLSLSEIDVYVKQFLKFAALSQLKKSDMYFTVTAIGCGLAGYKPKDIAPMFKLALNLTNVSLPIEFIRELEQ